MENNVCCMKILRELEFLNKLKYTIFRQISSKRKKRKPIKQLQYKNILSVSIMQKIYTKPF